MNFRQLFNAKRLCGYVNRRLEHPALAVPLGAPVYSLCTDDAGVNLALAGQPVGVESIPGLPGWLLERYRYWESAYHYALDYWWEQEPDAYALDSYGLSVAADMADVLAGRARVLYCGLELHSEKALAGYFVDRHFQGMRDGVPCGWTREMKDGCVPLEEDAPLTRYMQELGRAGCEDSGGFDATWDAFVSSGYFNAFIKFPESEARVFAPECMPGWMNDFCEKSLYCSQVLDYGDFSWHPWLFLHRENALLLDLALLLGRSSFAREYGGNRHACRPFPLPGE